MLKIIGLSEVLAVDRASQSPQTGLRQVSDQWMSAKRYIKTI